VCIEGGFRLNIVEDIECWCTFSRVVSFPESCFDRIDDSNLLLTNLGYTVGVAVNDSDSDGALSEDSEGALSGDSDGALSEDSDGAF